MITIYDRDYLIKEGNLTPSFCIVTEELNGLYELEMIHPYDDWDKWQRLENEKIIVAKTPRGHQPFRIYNITKKLDEITVNARHIFYDLNYNFIQNFKYTETASSILTKLKAELNYSTPFNFLTDITESEKLEFKNVNPTTVLFDEEIGFFTVFGGELLRDGYNVVINYAIGEDAGYTIEYGKNLSGLIVTEDYNNIITRLYTVGADNISAGYIDSSDINQYAYPRIALFEDSEATTTTLLEASARLKFLKEKIDLPSVNIQVDFVLLQNTEEYKNLSFLQDIKLGDVVTVKNKKMNFNQKAKVISYEFNCVTERYNKIQLGSFLPTISNSISVAEMTATASASATSTLNATTSTLNTIVQSHIADFNNPHKVTQSQVDEASTETE